MLLWHTFLLALLTLSAALPGPTRVADCQKDSTGVSCTRTVDGTETLTMLTRLQMSIIAYEYFLSRDRRVLSIDWEVLGCGEYKLPEYRPQGALADSTQCGPFNQAVDIYFNK